MKYPTMGQNPRNAVSVPALSGGVNFADALNLVDDNQMTDCKNVWYKDGVLKTRPGILEQGLYLKKDIQEQVKDVEEISGLFEINGMEYKLLVTTVDNIVTQVETKRLCCIPHFFNLTDDESVIIKAEIPKKYTSFVFYNGKSTKNTDEAEGKGLYLLGSLSNGVVVLEELMQKNEDYSFAELGADELYAPIVYINGKGSGFEAMVGEEATYAEGFSAFSDAWARYYYTTDAESHMYVLPNDIDNNYLKIECTDLNGATYTGSFYIENGTLYGKDSAVIGGNGQLVAEGAGADGKDLFLFFWINTKTKSIQALSSDKQLGGWPDAIGTITNNLKIMLRPRRVQKSILAGATKSNKFGGVSEGIYGGTRTFLTGFSGENKNLLVWSDLNNPTYFSENAYNHVGSANQQITALAKQDDMLVVFKENELFYATYVTGENYTADDVLAGRVIDITTLDARFPVVQINDKIGCDIPNSIQLCGDRLVWACTDNNVYMLRSANQYSTANIGIVSSLVKNKLVLSNAERVTSTTFEGFYVLKSAEKMFLLNYDYYYFNSLPAYSDTKKAQRKMQWFIWEVPCKYGNDLFESFFLKSNSLSLITYKKHNYTIGFWGFLLENGSDSIEEYGQYNEYNTLPIESVIQTKMFDFGAMERFKSIEQMYVGFGKVEGETAIQCLTDKGTLDKGVVEINENGDMQSPEFIETKRFLPGIKRALRFGLRLTASGKIAISGILIKYKYMGVTR